MKTCPKCKGTGKVPGEGVEDSIHRGYWDRVVSEQIERLTHFPPVLPFRSPDPAPHSVGASLTIGGQRWAWVFAGLPNICTKCGGRQGVCSWWWVAVDWSGDAGRIIGHMCDDCAQATTQDET